MLFITHQLRDIVYKPDTAMYHYITIAENIQLRSFSSMICDLKGHLRSLRGHLLSTTVLPNCPPIDYHCSINVTES